ncbi:MULTISPECIES: magnesium transporter CorA family protein [Enterococcus]|uniref:magnesium transporter CorA family protein n=1 Tax=Enterococcus TaxID=1350 RepID=UPI00065E516F|nr:MULTISPECIES: magnesium transporter CorA family protein [Enterococcus]KAF1301340.1 magnesium transporter CorA [Enterococcus sp. JM9B]
MIQYYTITDKKLVLCGDKKEDALWLHIEKPEIEEISEISKKFQLPSDYLTAILDDAENSRAEGLEQETFLRPVLLLLQFPYVSTSPSGYLQFETFPLSLIITPDKKLISVSNYHPTFFSKLIQQPLPNNDMSDRVNLTLEILWHLVLTYNDHLRAIKGQVEKLEGQIQVSTQNKHLYQIMDIQKSLVLFEAATEANFNTLKELAHSPEFKKNHAYRNHLHDILVETEQSTTSAKIHLKLVNQMTDIFSAIVSNNLNNVMKILTSLTIVLTIPTIVGGFFGMNVKLPFASRADAFFLISIATLILCYITIYYLRKKDLL